MDDETIRCLSRLEETVKWLSIGIVTYERRQIMPKESALRADRKSTANCGFNTAIAHFLLEVRKIETTRKFRGSADSTEAAGGRWPNQIKAESIECPGDFIPIWSDRHHR